MNRRGLATNHVPREIKPIQPDQSGFDYDAYVRKLEEDLKREEQQQKQRERLNLVEEKKLQLKAPTNPFEVLLNAFEGLKVQQSQKLSFKYIDLVQGLRTGRFKNILVCSGAGISVSAGIPDFRSPDSGLYTNLTDYNLPRPQSLFDLEYFIRNPDPYYRFSKEFNIKGCQPTLTHRFIRLLQDKDLLWKNMTQNVDNLEGKVGIKRDKLIQCHGSMDGAHCSVCGNQKDPAMLQQSIDRNEILYCDQNQCQGRKHPVKHNIIFFGEKLPKEFVQAQDQIFQEVDLCIVIGTSLAVAPFRHLPQCVNLQTCPQVLFNLENTNEPPASIDFTQEDTLRLFIRGKCDDTILKLVENIGCGWPEELEKLQL